MENLIAIRISGNADSIKELTHNSSEYRIKVWFTDLWNRQFSETITYADVLRVKIIKAE